MRHNFAAQFVQLLKCWLCDTGSHMEKQWALSVDECQLQASQFSIHLIDLLSILLRYNGFTRTQKAVVDQRGSSHHIVTMTFFAASLALGSALVVLLSPTTELDIPGCSIKSTFHRTSQSNIKMVCCCTE